MRGNGFELALQHGADFRDRFQVRLSKILQGRVQLFPLRLGGTLRFFAIPRGLFPEHSLLAFLRTVERLEALDQLSVGGSAAADKQENSGCDHRAGEESKESSENRIHALAINSDALGFQAAPSS